jgi:sarcosine/dimethylglycine N-methyltransferase
MAVQQRYEDHPIAQRNTDLYKEEYVQSFVRKWDELIDWEARAESEGDFFIRLLKERGVKRVLDVATGTGFHSVRLLQAGFDVDSVDGSPEMLVMAFENARRRGHILRTIHTDWRDLGEAIQSKYDAVICLGNSFTHLFAEQDRRKVLAEFYAALEPGGVLILDQRNYDGILDYGFSSKHVYYYCGENIRAEPEYMDEGLARFRYQFPDHSEFHLNMFPLRKEYTRRLMLEVGFQHVYSYADFQETHKVEDPDFFIHVAEKTPNKNRRSQPNQTYLKYSEIVQTARDYYNSSDADHFYATVWGGEDIHIGIYQHDTESIFDASRRTVQQLAAQIPNLDAKTRVLDIGSGYGGSARYLAMTYGCRVTCLNLSEAQNRRNFDLNRAQGLHLLINVVDGSFEEISLPDESVDLVWSQDALLHSGDRRRVLAEVNRVLARGGHFVFTDIMQSDSCSPDVMQPILDRINLESLGSLETYRKFAEQVGLAEVGWTDLSSHLSTHYARVLQEVQANYEELIRVCSEDYINRARIGLQYWIAGGHSGDLGWGIFHLRKP